MSNIELKQNILKNIETEIGKDAFDMWFKAVDISFMEGTVNFMMPNDFWHTTIMERYGETINRVAAKFNIPPEEITYITREPIEPLRTYVVADRADSVIEKIKTGNTFNTRINPNFTFDGFIEGQSNRFAYKASEAVVKKLGDRANNPLVIHSTPGLGKTHLLHSIGNQILKENPSAKILYMSGEEFVNEFIESLSNKTGDSFRKKYRSLDCFLMDDIQFVAGKGASVDAFFYTFNTLAESKKQIVLTSDRSPQQLEMEERLASRLLSGIVAEIKKPDFETRMAILRQKRDSHGFEISEEVIAFIAEGVQASIRELEGCLFRLVTYCNIHGVQATVPIAREVLVDILNLEIKKALINVNTIKKHVAKSFKVSADELNSKRKNHAVAWPRQIAMYLTTQMTDMSLPEIGREFDRDHSTVVHARDRVKEEIEKNPFFAAEINQIVADIKGLDK